VSSGGRALISAGGIASAATVSSGGTLAGPGTLEGAIADRGVVRGALLQGALSVSSGATESGGTILSGGAETVSSGGVASATTVSSGGRLTVLVTGKTVSTAILTGGLETVSSGATASAATIASGGKVSVTANAVTLGDIVASGGVEALGAGATASEATVLSGGSISGPGALAGATMDSGGVTSGVLISGAKLTIAAGGVATALTVVSGATVIDNGSAVYLESATVTFGGTLSGSGTVLENGKSSLVLSGATAAFTGTVALQAGTVELAGAAGAGRGAIAWTSTKSAATLQIDAADSPAAGSRYSGTLSNFDREYDALDLRGIAFVSGATAVLSGSTLVVTDGGKTYGFALAGTAARTYAVTADGSGGVLVKANTTSTVTLGLTPSIPLGGSEVRFVQALAAFSTGAAADGVYMTSVTNSLNLTAAHPGSGETGSRNFGDPLHIRNF
jgi:autotransporter passenger strand-loop-strand repeat protein